MYFCNLYLSSSRSFPEYFPGNLSSYEWIRDSFVQPTSSSFTEQEKENYIDSGVAKGGGLWAIAAGRHFAD